MMKKRQRKCLQFILVLVAISLQFSCDNKDNIESEVEIEDNIIKLGLSKESLLTSNSFNSILHILQNRNSNSLLNRNGIMSLTSDDLIKRLNLENTYFYSENGVEILNAPVRTLGHFKRSILSLSKNNFTNSYILTYPNPDSNEIFYVSNLEGVLIQKVTVGGDGIGIIEDYREVFKNWYSASHSQAMRKSCYQTIYQTCSRGLHSFETNDAAECIYWNNLDKGTPPIMYTVPVECSGGGDSPESDDNDGFSTPPPSIGGGGPTETSPEDCIPGLDCADCNFPADTNNDCEISNEEMQVYVFYQNLTVEQKNVYLDNKNEIDTYLIANTFNPEALVFTFTGLEALTEGGEVDFKNEILKDNTFVNTKADCVLEKLLTQTGYFKEVMNAFTNNNSTYKIKFTIAPLTKQNSHGEGETSPPDNNNIITITLAPGIVSKNALEIASVILHEGVHAQLFRMLASGNKAEYNLSAEDYTWLLKLENFWSTNSELPVSHHDFMTVRYVNKIANSIKKFDGNIYPIENYMFFGWDGLYDVATNRGLIDRIKFNEYLDLVQIPLNDNKNTPCD